jgi:hypothetical protein
VLHRRRRRLNAFDQRSSTDESPASSHRRHASPRQAPGGPTHAMLSFADDHGQITARPIGLGEHQIIKASTAVSQTALTR